MSEIKSHRRSGISSIRSQRPVVRGSRAIEQMMERAIAEREAEVVSAALRIETDPDFADVRAISDEVDALSADTAAKHLS